MYVKIITEINCTVIDIFLSIFVLKLGHMVIFLIQLSYDFIGMLYWENSPGIKLLGKCSKISNTSCLT